MCVYVYIDHIIYPYYTFVYMSLLLLCLFVVLGRVVGSTPQRLPERAPPLTEKQREGKQSEEGGKEDVTTHAAARARARRVNTSYVPEVGS